MSTGVVRVKCGACTAPFVIRVGESSEPPDEGRDPEQPLDLEGVTASASVSATAGEIGAAPQAAPFVRSETQSSIKLSPDLLEVAEQWRDAPTVVDGALPVVLTDDDATGEEGFESFGHVAPSTSTAPAPAAPNAAHVPTLPDQDISAFAPSAAAMPAAATQPPHPPGAYPPPGYAPHGWGAPTGPLPQMNVSYGAPPLAEAYDLQPRESRAAKAVGMFMLFIIFVAFAFGLFVLARNDWNLDFSNLDHMLERALGKETKATTGSLRDQLEISQPTLSSHQFLDGQRILAASGVVRNLRGGAKRYVYVRAEMLNGSLIVGRARAPAGNVFTKEELSTMDQQSLHSLSNPAGKNGRNAKIPVGGNVEYMVIFTELPPDYSPGKYKVATRVDSVEAHEAP